MFRRKEPQTADPLPYGLRSDLLRAGEKLSYRARSFHAAFGKDAETSQRDFLVDCRLTVLAFLSRKEHVSPLDRLAYGAAFSNVDAEADIRALLPRVGMRTLGQTLVLARQRGVTKAADEQLTEQEQATLEPLWSIIEYVAILPGNRNGREYAAGELGRIRTLLSDLLPGAQQPKNPTLIDRPVSLPAAPSMQEVIPEAPLAEAAASQSGQEAQVPARTVRPAHEVYDGFPWEAAFAGQPPHPEGGRFFLPSAVLPELEQAALRYRTVQLLLSRETEGQVGAAELTTLRRYQFFLLGAFFAAGLGPSVRDLRLLSRLMDLPAGFLNLEGWRELAAQLAAAAPDEVAGFLPQALISGPRDLSETLVITATEGALILFDALLALGSDDDGSRAAFRRGVYEAQLARARQYTGGANRRVREDLSPTPQLRGDLLGQALGERFSKLGESLPLPAAGEERRGALRADFTRHFLALFATAVRQPREPYFLRHSVTVMNALAGEHRLAPQWQVWHEDVLPTFGLDPFVAQPDYLRQLLHAASANAGQRARTEQFLGAVRSLVTTFVEDVLSGHGLTEVNEGFARQEALILDRLGPAAPPEPAPPPAPAAALPEQQAEASPPEQAAGPVQAVLGERPDLGPDLGDDDWDDLPAASAELEVSPGGSAQAREDPQSTGETPDDVMRDVNALVGLDGVKRELQQLSNLLKVRGLRQRSGLPVQEFSPHLILVGAAGAGHTTVASLVARLYHSLGVLERAELGELKLGPGTSRAGEAVQQALEQARGGALLLHLTGDAVGSQEAAALLQDHLSGQPAAPAVLLAGEQGTLDAALTPDLRSLFGRSLQLGGHTPAALAEILRRMAPRQGYRLTEEAAAAARLALEQGGAGPSLAGARQLFKAALTRHADRVAGLSEVSEDDLVRLEAEDFRPGQEENGY